MACSPQALRYCHFWLYNELKIVSASWETIAKIVLKSNWKILIEKKFEFVFGCLPKKSQSRPINFLTRNVEFVFFSFLFDSLMSYSSFIPRPFRALNCLRKIMRKYKWEWNECRLNRFLLRRFNLFVFLRRKLNNYWFEKVRDDLKF